MWEGDGVKGSGVLSLEMSYSKVRKIIEINRNKYKI